MIRLSSVSDATFAPYSNICPIAGWTGANVYHEDEYDADADPAVTISWQTEAGTVYGGTLDVTTGVLTVTHKLGTLPSDITYVTSSGWKAGSWHGNVFNDGKEVSGYSTIVDMLCDRAPVETPANIVSTSSAVVYGIGWGGAGKQIYFNFGSQYDTLAKIQTYLSENAVQVVYPLGTPATYQLTPTELKTLLGDNAIWADTGDTTVDYRADPTLYINKAIAAAVAAL